jgi:hypothetical protein
MVNGQPAIEKRMNASVIKILFAVCLVMPFCSPLK